MVFRCWQGGRGWFRDNEEVGALTQGGCDVGVEGVEDCSGGGDDEGGGGEGQGLEGEGRGEGDAGEEREASVELCWTPPCGERAEK